MGAGEAVTPHIVAGFLVIAAGFALTERRRLAAGLRSTVDRGRDAKSEGD